MGFKVFYFKSSSEVFVVSICFGIMSLIYILLGIEVDGNLGVEFWFEKLEIFLYIVWIGVIIFGVRKKFNNSK